MASTLSLAQYLLEHRHRELRNHSFHLNSLQIKFRNSKFESRTSPRAPLIAVVWPLSSQPRTGPTLKPYFERNGVFSPTLTKPPRPRSCLLFSCTSPFPNHIRSYLDPTSTLSFGVLANHPTIIVHSPPSCCTILPEFVGWIIILLPTTTPSHVNRYIFSR